MSAKNEIDDAFQEAKDLHNRGELPAAKEKYEYVIALDPVHFDALQLLGLASYQDGEFDRAVEIILRAIAINANSAIAYKILGNAYQRLSLLDSAVASYDRAIALLPAHAALYNDRGDALKRLNRLEDAVADYNKAISLRRDFAAAYNNLGVVLNEMKRHPEALATFEIAIRLKPDFALAHNNREIALADQAQWRLLYNYRAVFGVLPRLNPPIGFNERILHRIIYDRDPKLRIACDKLAVKGLIKERVGEDYAVPLLGVWERPAEIDWHTLPQKFVLKPNHSSGPFAIVDRSAETNTVQLVEAAEQWLSYDYFYKSLEWGYLGIPRRILAEPFLCSPNGAAAPEAQVHTFSGKAALIGILLGTKNSPDRSGCWFDVTGRRVAVKQVGAHVDFQLPDRDRHELIDIAERVSRGFSSLRVDFFITNDGLKIGELSPYTLGGMARWDSPELDEKLGQLWDLNCDLSVIPDYK